MKIYLEILGLERREKPKKNFIKIINNNLNGFIIFGKY